MTDITRFADFNQKKTVSVSTARVTHEMIKTANATALHEIFNLPDTALITLAGVVVEKAGQVGLTVDFGFAGGAELGNDLSMAAVAYVPGAALVAPLPTGTGKNVTAKFSAKPTAGEFVFICQYIEYDLANGMLTEVTAH